MNPLEVLVAACEEAFGRPEIGDKDEEDVAYPPLGITFGMIRNARKELENRHVD